MIVASIVVAVMIVGGSSSDHVDGTEGRTLRVPNSVAGYSRLTNVDLGDFEASMAAGLAKQGASRAAVLRHMKVGAYRKTGTASLIFFAIPLNDSPALRAEVLSHGWEGSMDKTIQNFDDGTASGSAPSYLPGPLGGSMRCFDGSVDGHATTSCLWGDHSAFGLTILLDPTSQPAAAELTRTLRGLTEK